MKFFIIILSGFLMVGCSQNIYNEIQTECNTTVCNLEKCMSENDDNCSSIMKEGDNSNTIENELKEKFPLYDCKRMINNHSNEDFVVCNKIVESNIFEGKLSKHGWSKTTDSFCAGGSDYLLFKTNYNKEYPVSYSEKYEEYVGKEVFITGKIKERQTSCEAEVMQCAETYCQVLEIDTIQVK